MVNYVIADPTKNITVLVTDEVPAEERRRVTEEMFAAVPSCEQVGYVTAPRLQGPAIARLEMMGGEFCGNASLSLAAFIAERDGITEPSILTIECSGVNEPFVCRIVKTGEKSYRGSLSMPVPEKIEHCDSHPVIFLPGIAHMIMPADRFTKKQVQNNIKDYAARCAADADAFGILLWDEAKQFMTPCVYVKGSDTIIWENGCATGSTCIGWNRCVTKGETATHVNQPGGTIDIDIIGGKPRLTGNVKLL